VYAPTNVYRRRVHYAGCFPGVACGGDDRILTCAMEAKRLDEFLEAVVEGVVANYFPKPVQKDAGSSERKCVSEKENDSIHGLHAAEVVFEAVNIMFIKLAERNLKHRDAVRAAREAVRRANGASTSSPSVIGTSLSPMVPVPLPFIQRQNSSRFSCV